MALKVKNFVIQAKANDGLEKSGKREKFEPKLSQHKLEITDSMKEEIIDECLEKVLHYLETKNKI